MRAVGWPRPFATRVHPYAVEGSAYFGNSYQAAKVLLGLIVNIPISLGYSQINIFYSRKPHHPKMCGAAGRLERWGRARLVNGVHKAEEFHAVHKSYKLIILSGVILPFRTIEVCAESRFVHMNAILAVGKH